MENKEQKKVIGKITNFSKVVRKDSEIAVVKAAHKSFTNYMSIWEKQNIDKVDPDADYEICYEENIVNDIKYLNFTKITCLKDYTKEYNNKKELLNYVIPDFEKTFKECMKKCEMKLIDKLWSKYSFKVCKFLQDVDKIEI